MRREALHRICIAASSEGGLQNADRIYRVSQPRPKWGAGWPSVGPDHQVSATSAPRARVRQPPVARKQCQVLGAERVGEHHENRESEGT